MAEEGKIRIVSQGDDDLRVFGPDGTDWTKEMRVGALRIEASPVDGIFVTMRLRGDFDLSVLPENAAVLVEPEGGEKQFLKEARRRKEDVAYCDECLSRLKHPTKCGQCGWRRPEEA